jgi:pimeloyl-ACP methyl ester carboxylesterase
MYFTNRINLKIASRIFNKCYTKSLSTRPNLVENTQEVKLHSSVVESSVPGVNKYLVYLHGLFGNSNNWRSISYSESIRELRRSLLVDLRNHGDSDHHDSMTYSEMADDVIRHIDSLNIDKFTLLGHSMGGKVAMNIGTRYSDRLDGLVIVDSAPKDHRDNKNIYGNTKQIVETVSEYNVDGKTRKEVLNDLKNMFNGSVANLLNTNLIYVTSDSDKVRWRCNLNAIKNNIDQIIGFEKNDETTYEGAITIIIGEKSFMFPIETYRTIFPHVQEHNIEIIKGAGKL